MISEEFEKNKRRFESNKDAAREAGRKGGKASGASKRKKKALKEAALAMMSGDIPDAQKAKIATQFELDYDEMMSLGASDLIAYGLVMKAAKGDVKAFSKLQEIANEEEKKKEKAKRQRNAKKERESINYFYLDKIRHAPEYERLNDIDKAAADLAAKSLDEIAFILTKERASLMEDGLVLEYDNGGGQRGVRINPRIAAIESLQDRWDHAYRSLSEITGGIAASKSDSEKIAKEYIIDAIEERKRRREEERRKEREKAIADEEDGACQDGKNQ